MLPHEYWMSLCVVPFVFTRRGRELWLDAGLSSSPAVPLGRFEWIPRGCRKGGSKQGDMCVFWHMGARVCQLSVNVRLCCCCCSLGTMSNISWHGSPSAHSEDRYKDTCSSGWISILHVVDFYFISLYFSFFSLCHPPNTGNGVQSLMNGWQILYNGAMPYPLTALFLCVCVCVKMHTSWRYVCTCVQKGYLAVS